MILKLTNEENKIMYVNFDNVAYFLKSGIIENGTYIDFSDDCNNHHVKESPEEIYQLLSEPKVYMIPGSKL